MKKLEVSAIEEGTVIDQIASKSTFKVANMLNIQDIDQVVLVGVNLTSKKLGKKGIIKIGGKSLTQEEVNKIALIATWRPGARRRPRPCGTMRLRGPCREARPCRAGRRFPGSSRPGGVSSPPP